MKKIIIVTIIFFNFKILAHDDHEKLPCIQKIPLEDYKDVEAINKHLEWHGATNSIIQKAPCKNLSTLNPEELNSYFFKKSQESKSNLNASVHGVNFSNESPALIDAFTSLTTAMDGFGFSKVPSRQKNFQKDFSINPECKKVLCAVTKIWGEDLGKKILYINLKHHFNASEYAFENSDRLKLDEIDDVIMGMEDLPKHLIPLGRSNQRLTHFSRGYGLKGDSPYVAANSVVMLFDTWTKEPRFERQYSVFHEMSHNVATRLGDMDEVPSWLKLSGWVKKGDSWNKNPNACFTTEYGLTNPFEDYAESLSTYRYNPKPFKESCPEKYNFIKDKVFKGKEYLSQESCSDVPSDKLSKFATSLAAGVEKELASVSLDKKIISEKCLSTFSQYPISEENIKTCKLILVKEQLAQNSSANLKILLSKENIQSNSPQLAQIQSQIAEIMISQGMLGIADDSISETSKNVFNENINQLINDSLPKKNDGKISGLEGMTNFSYSFNENCRQEIWDGIQASRRKCAIDFILKDEKKWQSFSSSRYFKKLNIPESFDKASIEALRERFHSEIEKQLIESDILDSFMSKSIEETKKMTKQYFSNKEYFIENEKSDWKKMTPQDFCQKMYNSPSDYYVKYIIPKNSNGYPGFLSWCEEKQSSKTKRFTFSEKELNDWVDSKIN